MHAPLDLRRFKFELRGKSDAVAFIDLGDQFIALQKGRTLLARTLRGAKRRSRRPPGNFATSVSVKFAGRRLNKFGIVRFSQRFRPVAGRNRTGPRSSRQ